MAEINWEQMAVKRRHHLSLDGLLCVPGCDPSHSEVVQEPCLLLNNSSTSISRNQPQAPSSISPLIGALPVRTLVAWLRRLNVSWASPASLTSTCSNLQPDYILLSGSCLWEIEEVQEFTWDGHPCFLSHSWSPSHPKVRTIIFTPSLSSAAVWATICGFPPALALNIPLAHCHIHRLREGRKV